MLITVNGLVTRSYQSGDHDRVIHILTEDHGRLSVMVKGTGSRRTGNGTAAACTQLFTYGNYELYRGKTGDLYWYRGGSVLNTFYSLAGDLTRAALANYLCDLASELTDEEQGTEESLVLLRMLLNSLYALKSGLRSPTVIKAVFELRAMALMGYRPDLTGCDLCGEGFPEQAYFDIMNGRLICADCQTKRNRIGSREAFNTDSELRERQIICPVSASVLAAMRYVLSADDRKIFSFALKDREEELSFGRTAETFLLNQLERDFDTLAFYRSVAE